MRPAAASRGMDLEVTVVDAFTDVPFRGNPAGVVVRDGPLGAAVMQDVARELAHAETSFLWPEGGGWRLRWFTPTVEMDLCGHATLAAAHVLAERGMLADGATARFATMSGELRATRRGRRVELDFPAEPPQPAPEPVPLAAALGGAKVLACTRNRLDYYVVLEDEAAVRALEPDLGAVARLDRRGLCVTAAGGRFDFVLRLFAPQVGIPEDPVTGSAHCGLAPLWAARLGRTRFRAHQASARGGELDVEVVGDRVRLTGDAVMTLRGRMSVA